MSARKSIVPLEEESVEVVCIWYQSNSADFFHASVRGWRQTYCPRRMSIMSALTTPIYSLAEYITGRSNYPLTRFA